jgi:hypothetical protein
MTPMAAWRLRHRVGPDFGPTLVKKVKRATHASARPTMEVQAITWLPHRRLSKSSGHAHDRNIPA